MSFVQNFIEHVVVKHGEAQVDPSVMPEMFL
jgi:hypothetical protein